MSPNGVNPKFEPFLKLLLKWNKTYNLTAITQPEEIRVKHFEDSLAVLPCLPAKGRILDIGSGAGFPGIPIKIERPQLEVVLLDSQRKKISFCEAAIRELGLEKISARHGRAEDPKIISALGKFDVVISRATFSLSDFLEIALPYCKDGGTAMAMKMANWREEYKPSPKWELKKEIPYELSEISGKRVLLIFSQLGK